jgi:alkanesulfonate monooxygenase SsuD/methylene tetrahydromethanopterin reductase-like flavin-dependent oxidoreductase (luciferase family)
METGVQLYFQNLHEAGLTDAEVFAGDVRLAELAEPLGFGGIYCVEHHFDSAYSFCPDNMQLLTYLAAKTERVKLVPAGVILPWWTQPVRVAEKMAMLDQLSGGRAVLGVGRGLSRMEYGQLGIDMNESRERFDESIEIVLNALETGVVEGKGKFFDILRSPLAPPPTRGFRDRVVVIAMSPDSLQVAANLGAAMITFVQFPAEQHAAMLGPYRETFRAVHGREAPIPTLSEFITCHEDSAEAERMAIKHGTRNFASLNRHYEFSGGHFAETKGYSHHAAVASLLAEAGEDAAGLAWAQCQTYGTPEEVIEKIHIRRSIVGEYQLNCCFSFGGMEFDKAEASMRLFAEKVLPELSRLPVAPIPEPAGQVA